MLAALLSSPGIFSLFADAESCSRSILGLKTWFAYFPPEWIGGAGYGECDINGNFQLLSQAGGPNGALLIAMAILDDLIRIAALVAVGYIIYGGFTYLTSQGAPDVTKKAQTTIINALVGVAIAVIAAAGVSYIGHKLGSVN